MLTSCCDELKKNHPSSFDSITSSGGKFGTDIPCQTEKNTIFLDDSLDMVHLAGQDYPSRLRPRVQTPPQPTSSWNHGPPSSQHSSSQQSSPASSEKSMAHHQQHYPPPPYQHHHHHHPYAPPHPMVTPHWHHPPPYPPPPPPGYNHPPPHGAPPPPMMGYHHHHHHGMPPPPQGFYPPPPLHHVMYPPPPITTYPEPDHAAPKYPGKDVRPLPNDVYLGHRALHGAPPMPRPPSSLASPVRKRRKTVESTPWSTLKDLQHAVRNRRGENNNNNNKVSVYSQMNQQWQTLLKQLGAQTKQRGETLDQERLSVVLTCLGDRDPCNYTNLGLALECCQTLTATAYHRMQVVDTKLYAALIKLVEWPVASRVLGQDNIQLIFQIMVALLEDPAVQARMGPAQDLMTKLSTVTASIWLTWHEHDKIAQLARRALVAIHPHYEDSNDEDDDDDKRATLVESPTCQQDTLPPAVSTDNSLESPTAETDPPSEHSFADFSCEPLQWDASTNQVNPDHDDQDRSTSEKKNPKKKRHCPDWSSDNNTNENNEHVKLWPGDKNNRDSSHEEVWLEKSGRPASSSLSSSPVSKTFSLGYVAKEDVENHDTR